MLAVAIFVYLFVRSDMDVFLCRNETGLFLVVVLFTVGLPLRCLLGQSLAGPPFSSSLLLHRLVVAVDRFHSPPSSPSHSDLIQFFVSFDVFVSVDFSVLVAGDFERCC